MNKSALQALTTGAALLGAAVGKKMRGKKAPKKHPALQKAKKMLRDAPIFPRRQSQTTAALMPVAYPIRTRNVSWKPGVITIPFDAAVCPISTTSGATLVFGATTSTAISVDLSPLGTIGIYYTLGQSINALGGSYNQWRLTDLTVSYLPGCSTATVGTIVLAYDPDPFISGGTYNMSTVGSNVDNMIFSVSSPASMRVTTLKKDWLYTYADTGTSSAQRQCYDGTFIIVSGIAPPASASLGIFKLSGSIQFRDLGNSVNLEEQLARSVQNTKNLQSLLCLSDATTSLLEQPIEAPCTTSSSFHPTSASTSSSSSSPSFSKHDIVYVERKL